MNTYNYTHMLPGNTPIAFDLGNVLFNVNINYFLNKLIEWRCVKDLKESIHLMARVEHLNYLGCARIDWYLHEKFPSISAEEFLYEWNKIVTPNAIMLDFVEEILIEHPVAFLSNMGVEHAEFLRNKHESLFKNTINHLSFEVGSFKPQKLFFQSFIMENPSFQSCEFLDDRIENIKMATILGFNSRLFDLNKFNSLDELKTELNKIKRAISI